MYILEGIGIMLVVWAVAGPSRGDATQSRQGVFGFIWKD